MALTYTTYTQTMRTMLEIPLNKTDTAFESIIGPMIEYGEGRIYREFDFLCTYASQTATLVVSNRNVALPANVIDLSALNVVTPVSTAPDAGTRNPLTRVGIDFLNAVYNSTSGAAVPKFYALIGTPTISTTISAGTYNILLGPVPDQAYTLECIGTIRPSFLSPSVTTDFISTNLPDLLVAASMIFGTGYQQNFGSQSDNPQMAQSWETQYQALKASANLEELRRKSENGTPYQPPANTARAV